MRAKLEVLALVLGFLGLFGTIAVTALPMWRVSAFIELQASRGLMCFSIALVFIALVITGCGTKKSSCCDDNAKGKNITLALGGSLYLLSCVTTLIPVSWVGHTVIRNFYNPVVVDSQKRELGKALFIGWATSGVLLITGIILLLSYSRRRKKEEKPYADVYLMESAHLERIPSNSSHKHHEYV
ncbi:uncharacterized protein V6R79_021757 [Siganus canaliculatus]